MAEVRQSHGFPLAVALHTDVGRVRTNNEDSSASAWLPDGSLWVMVADGMGGHEAGEVASGLAVRVVEEYVGRDTDQDPRERLFGGLMEANEAILEEGRRSGTRGMGTTAITGLFHGAQVYVAQVGDSRIYHIRRGQMVWRTSDHTRVQMLVDQGQLTEEDAREHPESGMLTRALGHARMADGRPLAPEVLADPITMQEADAVVFCSDGLHDLLGDEEIGHLIAGRTPEEAARALVEVACERGGHDNVTVAVVVSGPQTSALDPTYVPETWGVSQAEPTLPPAALHSGPPSPQPASPWSAGLPLHVSGPQGASLHPSRPPAAASLPPAEEPRSRSLIVGFAAFGALGVVAVVLLLLALVLGAGAWYWSARAPAPIEDVEDLPAD
ncbi:MAG: serine/threonine-protein phosphatase [Deltaproteobacteria bacterium]|nr:serine/threonine-protein phosphatase [Deltaproteobacteria bacterium]